MINKTFYKTPGFYVSLASIVLLVLGTLFYLTFGGDLEEYKNLIVLVPVLLGIVLYFGLLVFTRTSKYAGFLLWVGELFAFLLFVRYVYMYFSGVFYNGITSEALKLINPKVAVSAILLFVSFILGNVGMYFKTTKESVKGETRNA